MSEDGPPPGDGTDVSGLASVVQVGRDEEIAAVCGRIDAAPTFAVVVHAPRGNHALSTELGIRRLVRHAEEGGRVVAIATRSRVLSSRARQAGLPVARRPDHVRWDAGGRTIFRFARHSFALPPGGRFIPPTLLLLAIGAFVALLLTLAPSARVVAYPPTETVSTIVTITASARANAIDFERLVVPASRVSAERTVTLALRTTGRVNVGIAPARAGLVITNPSGAAITIPAGTEVAAGQGGAVFALDGPVGVAAGQAAPASATARTLGSAANVAAGSLTAWVDPRFRAYPVTNPEPAAGGADEVRPAVDAADVVAITTMAEDLARSETLRRAIIAARPHDAIFLQTAETAVALGEIPLPVGTPADILTLEVKVTVTALAVLAGTLEQVAAALLAGEREGGELIRGSITAVEIGARRADADDGSVRTAIELRGELARGVASTAVERAVKGRSVGAARSTLAKTYGIDEADITLSPGWAPWLPRFGFRIEVELRGSPTPRAAASEASPASARPAETVIPTATASPGP